VRDAHGKLIPEQVKRAKLEATELSNRLMRGDRPVDQATTIDMLFGLYERERLDRLSVAQQAAVRRELELWRNFLGSRFVVSRLGMKEWSQLERLRRSGEIDARGRQVPDPANRRAVGPRAIAKSLKALRQVCRFGVSYRLPSGQYVLELNPTSGLEIPREENPRRPVADSDRFEKLLAVADRVTMYGPDGHRVRSYLRELLVLAEGTGRRVSAVLALRWSDWKPGVGLHGTIHWRAASDKIGRDWVTPVTAQVREALEGLRAVSPLSGDGLIFHVPADHERPVTRHAATSWLRRAEELAGLDHMPGGAWHCFRRQWASARKHLAVADVAYAGGWADTSTLLTCYQRPDPETVEEVVNGGRRLRMVG
jgi:integrase